MEGRQRVQKLLTHTTRFIYEVSMISPLIQDAIEQIHCFHATEGYHPEFLWVPSMQATEADIAQLNRLKLIGTSRQDPLFETWGINWRVDEVLSYNSQQ